MGCITVDRGLLHFSIMIRPANKSDSEHIARIYNHYVKNSVVTFEEEEVSVEEMRGRICATLDSSLPWLVLEEAEQVLGFAYASKWKGRCAYKYSVESTIYLNHAAHSKGLGSLLYEELLNQLNEQNYHVVLGGISLPNDLSVAMHEKFGFKKVAHLEEVGFKFDEWVDVGYWQLMLQD